MTVVAIANQKGGVGKTTTAVSLATCLAARGLQVLLIDLDPQGNATTNLGIATGSIHDSAYALFAERNGTPERCSKTTLIPGLRLIPATMDLAGLDLELSGAEDKAVRLRRRLHARDKLPGFVILDTPPSFGVIALNALVAADYALVPLQCEFLALEGLAHLKRTLDAVRSGYNPTLGLLGIVLTMYDRRHNLSELVANDVRSVFGSLVFDTQIPRNVRLAEAPSHGLPITKYDGRSPGALAYERLSDEVLARIRTHSRHA